MTDRDTVWGWVAAQRLALADALEELPTTAWDLPSQCDGWRVRDVVGHLVNLAEASRPSVMIDMFRQLRPPNAALSRIAKREGGAEPNELVDRLRAAANGRFVVPTQPPAAALGEVIVHGVDALRPVGGAEPPAESDRTHAVAEAYRRIGPVFRTARAARRVRFAPTDADWTIGPNTGPVAEGAAVDVLLTLAGRKQGASALSGPGAELLGGATRNATTGR